MNAVNKSKQLVGVVDTPKLKHVEYQTLETRAVAAKLQVLPILQITCFVAGTPVLTAEGSRPIESLKVGDTVLSRPENNVEVPVRPKIVAAMFELSAKVVELHVGGQVLETTAEHPMFVDGVGWRPAHELQAGDLLIGHDLQRTAVEKVLLTDRTETVYNLRVADDHTRIVNNESLVISARFQRPTEAGCVQPSDSLHWLRPCRPTPLTRRLTLFCAHFKPSPTGTAGLGAR